MRFRLVVSISRKGMSNCCLLQSLMLDLCLLLIKLMLILDIIRVGFLEVITVGLLLRMLIMRCWLQGLGLLMKMGFIILLRIRGEKNGVWMGTLKLKL